MRPLHMVLAAVLLVGCSLISPPPEPAKEVLSELPSMIPHGRRQLTTLIVLPPDTSPAYDTTRMAYMERPYQLAYFRDHEWAVPPAEMIQKLLVQTLEQTGSFRAVLTPPDFARSAYVLRTELLELVQDYTKAPPVLRLMLRVELLGPFNRPVANREITVRERMQQAAPYAGVVAANRATAQALQNVADFVLAHVR